MMSLSFAKIGKEIEIKEIIGNDDVKVFLNRLGFIEGHKITVVSKVAGTLILNVKDTRIALDRQLSSRIVI